MKKGKKTKKDFFLEEDFEAYEALQDMTAFFALCEVDEDQKKQFAKLLDAVESRCYRSGHANAEFEANGEGC